jgi:hypothetical protein
LGLGGTSSRSVLSRKATVVAEPTQPVQPVQTINPVVKETPKEKEPVVTTTTTKETVTSPLTSPRPETKKEPVTTAPPKESVQYKAGFLTKEGDKIKTWKKRHARLHDNWLSYYNEPNDTEPIKSINVKGGKAFNALSKCSSSRPYVFEFRVSGKVYYFNAASEDDKAGWMKALNSLIEKVNADKTIKEGGDLGPGEE